MKTIITFSVLLILQSLVFAQSFQTDSNIIHKRFDQVVFPTTHNSFNYKYGPKQFIHPNQEFDISRQLKDGIRGFMIDIHYYNGPKPELKGSQDIFVFHGEAILGYQTLFEILTEFNTFLEENPKEIVTIIFDCKVPESERVAALIKSHPVYNKVFHKTSTQWPSIQDMIQINQRLVLITHCKAYEDWYLHQHDYCYENNWRNNSIDGYNCEIVRGDTSKEIFIFNHFLYNGARISKNHKANKEEFLVSHIEKCTRETGSIPNFVTVDFYDGGDIFEVVNKLNRRIYAFQKGYE